MARNNFPEACQFKPTYGYEIADYCEVAIAWGEMK